MYLNENIVVNLREKKTRINKIYIYFYRRSSLKWKYYFIACFNKYRLFTAILLNITSQLIQIVIYKYPLISYKYLYVIIIYIPLLNFLLHNSDAILI